MHSDDAPHTETENEDVSKPSTDPEFIAASNLDVANRKPNDEIEPVDETRSTVGSQSGGVLFVPNPNYAGEGNSDVGDDSNVTKSNDPNSTSNTGDAGENTKPAGDTQTTPIQAELDRVALDSARSPNPDQVGQESATGGDTDNSGSSTGSKPTGFAALSAAEKK